MRARIRATPPVCSNLSSYVLFSAEPPNVFASYLV